MRNSMGRFIKGNKPTHGFIKGHSINKRTQVTRVCILCSKEFKTTPSRIKDGKGKYCSIKCYNIAKKGTRCGPLNNKWKGGKYITFQGYIVVISKTHPFCNNQGYIAEHRLVVEQQIKRFLTSKEVVHHIGEKTDNRPHMLMAFINNVVHMRFERGQNINPNDIIFDGRKLHHDPVTSDSITMLKI